MAETAYCTPDDLTLLAGQLAVDLRTDDGDLGTLITRAIDFGSGQVDFYCSRYDGDDLAESRWVRDVATALALEWLSTHRLNEVAKSLAAMIEVFRGQLELIQKGQAEVPRTAASRRAVTVTNTTVDLNRRNNQVRIDRGRSTGVAKDYRRPTDPFAPDQR